MSFTLILMQASHLKHGSRNMKRFAGWFFSSWWRFLDENSSSETWRSWVWKVFKSYLAKKPMSLLLILPYKNQQKFMIVFELLRDLKMIMFHMLCLLISNPRILSCDHTQTKNLNVLFLYADYNHRQIQIFPPEVWAE